MGLKLGAELLRSPNGIWYSATGADGGTLGVLRFEAALLKPAGAVDRLVERVVAARAGMLPGTLPVVDLVEDGGRIWLITAQVPVAETAGRTEALLLGSSPVSARGAVGAVGAVGGVGVVGGPGGVGALAGPVGSVGPGGPLGPVGTGPNTANGANGYAAQNSPAEAPWRPAIDLGPNRVGGGQPQWTNKELKDPVGRRLLRALVGVTLVAVVIGAATVVGLKMRDKKPTTPVQISSISVHNAGQVDPTAICDTTIDMVADLTTNGGAGNVHYEWDIPQGNNSRQIKPGTESIDAKNKTVHLNWRLKLSGTGKVTAKFRITNPEVLAQGADSSSSGDLNYKCP